MTYILANDRTARAIKEGRQTQHRVPVKPQPPDTPDTWWTYHPETYVHELRRVVDGELHLGDNPVFRVRPPWQPGELLYVREAHRVSTDCDSFEIAVQYRADGEIRPLVDDVRHRHVTPLGKWRPNIHMPKKWARTWVRVFRVWVERVQDISEADAMAEGVDPYECASGPANPWPEQAFAELWDSMYAARGFGWAENPWVWACEFQREEPSR